MSYSTFEVFFVSAEWLQEKLLNPNHCWSLSHGHGGARSVSRKNVGNHLQIQIGHGLSIHKINTFRKLVKLMRTRKRNKPPPVCMDMSWINFLHLLNYMSWLPLEHHVLATGHQELGASKTLNHPASDL